VSWSSVNGMFVGLLQRDPLDRVADAQVQPEL
jgi:hypothetical protein